LLQGPGVGTVLRLDDGPVSLGGVAGSTVRLDEPGCEAAELLVRPLVDGQVEVVRRGGPVGLYVGVDRVERRLLCTNDVLGGGGRSRRRGGNIAGAGVEAERGRRDGRVSVESVRA
ncbi:MAG: hypothetical protein MUF34_32995, partial [Polyangiaceae bacterium]|nr:hypothetical protein [Polyangiaceae bacterium]